MNPSTLEEILQSLESVLKEYSEISATCQEMVHGLRDIGDYMTRIETGRQKILTGVESILKNLSHLDRLAQNGMQVGAGPSGSPRRILLVRIAPDGEQANRPARVEEDDDEAPAGDTVVH
ncbi:MAG TPA: hypothetical protein VJV23_06320 [Candidatus Polarisedimenticolia bacterium]|nr:hypothetical protein [Candidatus Polarisedimenticolia bacterium]